MEQTVQQTRNDTAKAICMECAMRGHTFNELTGRGEKSDYFDHILCPKP